MLTVEDQFAREALATETDFSLPGKRVVAVQQGDRLKALAHLPHGEDFGIKRKATEMCISFNSSIEEILNTEHALLGQLP